MNKRTTAVAAVLAAVFIWGTTFIAIKVALGALHPFTLAVVRFALAFAVLLPLARREVGRQPWSACWPDLALLGLTGGALYFGFQNLGLAYTTASKASLILASIPAMTALLAAIWLREPVRPFRVAGITVSAGGVGLIVASDLGSGWGVASVGDLLIVGSALAWAVYTVQAKMMEQRASPTVISAASVGFGALYLLPLVLWELEAAPTTAPSLEGWMAVAYLGFFASALPFWLWNYALARIDAAEVSVYLNLVPVVAVAGGVLLLGEKVTWLHLAGGGMVLAGVLASSHRR